MALDASRLTREESDELLFALRDREKKLERRLEPGRNITDARGAKWRLFVVRSMLSALGVK